MARRISPPGSDGFRTDPTDADTDRDLFADAFEIARGSDPTDPTSIPSDVPVIEFTGLFEAKGKPVSGVPIRIEDRNGNALCSGKIDATDRFSCGLQAGIIVRFVAEAFGSTRASAPITVVDQGDGTMQVHLDLFIDFD